MKPLSIRTKQTGMTTLLIAAVMLIAATLIVFVSGRSGVQEQRISANERREAEAFAQAQARLDQAMVFFKGWNSPNDLVNYHNRADVKSTRFCNAPPTANPCPTTKDGAITNEFCTPYDPNVLVNGSRVGPTVVACGWSDDGSARQFVMQQFSRAPVGGSPHPPANPLTSRSGVGATGSFTMVNYFENLTVWTGDNLESGSATAKTFTRFPNSATPNVNPHSSSYLNSYILAATLTGSVTKDASSGEYIYSGVNIPTNSNTSYLIKSTDKSAQNTYIGGDVVDKDYFLKNFPTWQEFFEYFFCNTAAGENAATFKSSLDKNVMTPAQASANLAKMGGQTVWVTGDFSLPNSRVGSISNPVVLIVEGNLTISSNSDFYGLIFVTGYLTGNGGPTIYGAVIVYDNGTNLTGNGAIVYDPVTVTNAINTSGGAGLVSGTWRDWAGN